MERMNKTIDNQPQGQQARPRKQKLLQPLSASLDPVALRQMMASWKTAGLSYTQMFKMLKLYLGETAWMDRKGEYPRANFYLMAKGLKFHSITLFLKCLYHCAGFGFVWSGQEWVSDNLVAVFSLRWHQPAKGEKVTYSAGGPAKDEKVTCSEGGPAGDEAGDAALHSPDSTPDNNIYMSPL